MDSPEAQLKTLADEVRALNQYGIREDAIGTGEALAKAKAILKHGHWYPWIIKEFGWTPRTAQRYIRVYRVFGSNATPRVPKSHLQPTGPAVATREITAPLPLWASGARLRVHASALWLLSERKVSQALRRQVIEAANSGLYISKADAEDMIWAWNRQVIVVKKKKALCSAAI